MFSKTPIEFEKLKPKNVDRQILRFGIQAELDAINLC